MNNILKMLPPISENEKGDLYSLTQEQRLKVKQLVRKECCNYNAELGECFLLDEGRGGVCPQMISNHIICRWFNHAVLPLNLKLYKELIGDLSSKKCIICGSPYISRSNNAKYCPSCKRKVARKQKAEWIKKHRSVVEK